MNKELTPLETFKELLFVAKNYSSDNVGGYLEEFYKDKLDIIETALKNYEHLYQIWNCKDSDTMIIQTTKTIHDENNKKLKALEIIKERLKYFTDYDESTKTIYINGAIDCDNQEYDLLKEVLL